MGYPAASRTGPSKRGVCPPSCTTHRPGPLHGGHGEHVLGGQRFEVEPVRGVVVGGDRLRVAVHHHRLVAGLGQGLAGVDAAVVEFDPLADAVRARAEHHHRALRRSAGPRPRPRRSRRSRGSAPGTRRRRCPPACRWSPPRPPAGAGGPPLRCGRRGGLPGGRQKPVRLARRSRPGSRLTGLQFPAHRDDLADPIDEPAVDAGAAGDLGGVEAAAQRLADLEDALRRRHRRGASRSSASPRRQQRRLRPGRRSARPARSPGCAGPSAGPRGRCARWPWPLRRSAWRCPGGRVVSGNLAKSKRGAFTTT